MISLYLNECESWSVSAVQYKNSSTLSRIERVVSGNLPVLQRIGGGEELVCYKRSVLMVRVPGVLIHGWMQ